MASISQDFDGPLGKKIIELHVWAVGEGLRGADASQLLDGLCRRLVGAGVPLWRAFAGMKALHPQWGGYGLYLVAAPQRNSARAVRTRR
jgi:adenylate cyclase